MGQKSSKRTRHIQNPPNNNQTTQLPTQIQPSQPLQTQRIIILPQPPQNQPPQLIQTPQTSNQANILLSPWRKERDSEMTKRYAQLMMEERDKEEGIRIKREEEEAKAFQIFTSGPYFDPQELPEEILGVILSFLNYQSLVKCLRVSKKFYK